MAKVNAEVKDTKVKGDAVDVFDANGQYVRSYTKARHGKGYVALAEEFVKGHEGCKVVKHDAKAVDAFGGEK